jgi:hypothetical protein
MIRFRAGTIVQQLKAMRQHLLNEIDEARERVPFNARTVEAKSAGDDEEAVDLIKPSKNR